MKKSKPPEKTQFLVLDSAGEPVGIYDAKRDAVVKGGVAKRDEARGPAIMFTNCSPVGLEGLGRLLETGEIGSRQGRGASSGKKAKAPTAKKKADTAPAPKKAGAKNPTASEAVQRKTSGKSEAAVKSSPKSSRR